MQPPAPEPTPRQKRHLALLLLSLGIGMAYWAVGVPIREAREHVERTVYIHPQMIFLSSVVIVAAVGIFSGCRPGRSEKIMFRIGIGVAIAVTVILVKVLGDLGYPWRW